MYTKLLKFVGINIIISGVLVIGKRVIRKVQMDYATKKYDKACEDYKNRTHVIKCKICSNSIGKNIYHLEPACSHE